MQDPRYAETFEALAAVCAERNVALQTIKSLARRRWDGREHTAATWYEPLREQADIDLAVHWVLGRPEAFLLTTGDVEILPRLLDAAERFERRPADDEMARAGRAGGGRAAVRLSGQRRTELSPGHEERLQPHRAVLVLRRLLDLLEQQGRRGAAHLLAGLVERGDRDDAVPRRPVVVVADDRDVLGYPEPPVDGERLDQRRARAGRRRPARRRAGPRPDGGAARRRPPGRRGRSRRSCAPAPA